MQWVASTLHSSSEHVVSSITTADGAQLGCQQSAELTPHRTDLNGLIRFAERRNLVSARVPSHFNWPLSATGRSLVQSNPTDYGASECDLETSTMSRPWPTRDCPDMKKTYIHYAGGINVFSRGKEIY